MPFDYTTIELPVREVIPGVQDALSSDTTLILTAPPGAGKSTLVPAALLDSPWLNGKKIIMLEPRRLAAKTIAYRVASLLGENVGETVGYRIRFESKVSAATRLEIVTEGMLTRMLQQDNGLEDYGLVIFDEFHERSLHADLAMALCRESQKYLRPDLRILIMSATIDASSLSKLLKAPVIKSEGRIFPVQTFFGEDADISLLPELMANVINKAISDNDGDVLAFLPGEGEIRKTEELCLKHFPAFSIHPLYGQLSMADQERAILPSSTGKRKIVLATSIAETSLTIEGIKIVIDSGFGRVSRYDPASGLSRLETIRISKDSADQRAGRAGRLAPGVCYRMWTMATHQRLSPQRTPEVLEADLTPLMLELAQWGITDPTSLEWLTVPPAASISQASEALHEIGALNNSRITPHGLEIHQLPCHPRIAHMLITADTQREKQLGCDLAAAIEERDPMGRETGTDINLRIEALRRYRSRGPVSGRFTRIEKTSAQYRKMLRIEADNGPVDAHETGLLLAHAFPERIACARPGNNAQFQLANGKIAAIGHQDDLAHEPWICVANMDLREGLGKIFLASPINPKDLAGLVRQRDNVSWDSRKGGLIANRELKVGNIVLKSESLKQIPDERIWEAALTAIRSEGKSLLNIDEEFEQLVARLNTLRLWRPELNVPMFSVETLLQQPDWLQPYVNVRRNEDLKAIDLSASLYHSLDYELQQSLDRLAPARIKVPSGSMIRIQYYPNGQTPALYVRLQEVFGLEETPLVNDDKVRLVLHLLSPGYKPVQVTTDLKSFWNNLYFEVKKELQRRYPKHAWPDDPWSAKAVAKGRSHK